MQWYRVSAQVYWQLQRISTYPAPLTKFYFLLTLSRGCDRYLEDNSSCRVVRLNRVITSQVQYIQLSMSGDDRLVD